MPAKNGATWKTKSIWPDIREKLDNYDTIIVFDLETTGLSSKTDRIIEIAAVKYRVESDYTLNEMDTFHQYINPGCKLSEVITNLTGITDEQLADKPTEDVVYDAVKAFFSGCLVAGYNIDTFDVKFMNEYYGRMGEVFNTPGTVDAIKMARNILVKDVDVENYKLATIGNYFGLDFQAHSAIEDARTTGTIIKLFISEYTQANETFVDSPAVVHGALRPTVQRIAYWDGFKGFARIYITTDAGVIYYDIRSNSWGGKDIDIREIDMAWIESEVFDILDIKNEAELAAFKGNLNIA